MDTTDTSDRGKIDREAELEEIRIRLEEGYEQMFESGEKRLQFVEDALTAEMKNMLLIYSNDMRNIGIVAGTAAPFSLTLLSIDRINVDVLSLVLGFCVLLLTVTITQFFLYVLSYSYDKRLLNAELGWLFAKGSLRSLSEKSGQPEERINHMFDYQKRVTEAERSLGVGTMDPIIIKLRARMRRYSSISFMLLLLGIILIIFSVIIPSILSVFYG